MIRALIFDFDGLILDTEKPDYDAWCAIYAEHGHEMPLEQYLTIIGTSLDVAAFVPVEHLAELVETPFDRTEMEARARGERLALIDAQDALPGVVEQIEAAKARGLKLAVASSSPLAWVARHMERLGLLHHFDVVVTKDDVASVKPAPDLFEAALAALGVGPEQAIVFEDSEHGVQAATEVGIFTVAVPNFLTAYSDLSAADMRLDSLASVDLDDLLTYAVNGKAAAMQQQLIERSADGVIMYDPRSQRQRVTNWLGYLVLGPALLIAGTALLWKALAQRQAGKPVQRWLGLVSAALSAFATGAVFVAEGLRNRRLYVSIIDAGE